MRVGIGAHNGWFWSSKELNSLTQAESVALWQGQHVLQLLVSQIDLSMVEGYYKGTQEALTVALSDRLWPC